MHLGRWKVLFSLLSAGVLATMLLSTAFASEHTGQEDRHFVEDEGSGNLMEITLGQLAQTHASSDAVKTFGQRMITDHSRLRDTLAVVAPQVSITPPTTLLPEHQAAVNWLSTLSGTAFDQAYMRFMVVDHTGDLVAYESEIARGAKNELKAYANDNVQTIADHLALAHSVAASIGADVSISR